MTNCSLLAEDCTLVNQKTAFRLGGSWNVQRTTVANVTAGTLTVLEVGSGTFRDCILAKGAHGVFVDPSLTGKRSGPLVHFDMRNNWWGTDNPDSIQAWIYDELAQPGLGYIVDWQPYTGQPVPTEQQNFGDLKALFR